MTTDEQIVATNAVVGTLLEQASEQVQGQYGWRHRLLRTSLWQQIAQLNPDVATLIGEQFPGYLPLITTYPAGLQYSQMCRDQQVPIPPDWRDPAWQRSPGNLTQLFVSGEYPTVEVWTYTDPEVAGVCYALPRKSGNVTMQLGIICQSEKTGKACFWDNKDGRTEASIRGQDPLLIISELRNGLNLSENCTDCHRGYNAFVIHPGTPLVAPGVNRDPVVRYSPIGQSDWVNPPPISLRRVTPPQRACNGCHNHEIPDPRHRLGPSRGYCPLLRQAVERTMPPGGPYTSWFMPSGAFSSHINELRGWCR
jgi:hypothetical protein